MTDHTTAFGADAAAVSSVAMEGATNYFRWQLEVMSSHIGPRVLEIGCGVGEFTRVLLGRERVVSVDLKSDMIEHVRERMAGHAEWYGLVADVTDPSLADQAEVHRCTSVTAINVIEHIEDDEAILAAIRRLLPTGGTAAVLVPAHAALYGTLDEAAGHYRRYTKSEIARKVEAAGFRVDRTMYFNAVGAIGWYVNYRILRIRSVNEGTKAQVGVFDKLIVPVARMAERFVEPPFGISAVCLATAV
ncbi:MAG: class I SAM-dependent methyltransferase [Myxococcales bacterium]|jgi:SAM-dependent methyltransferase|nr:MAG: class I SAM-dependent methyltransferase [Myxococcales bacterium]